MIQNAIFEPQSLPCSLRFDRSWRHLSTVQHVSQYEATPLIKRHYLGKWPGVSVCSLGMYCQDWLAGVLVFALPPSETSMRYGMATWELARLWIHDDVPGNAETWLIGQSVKHVRRHHPEVEMLVSYADPSAGHTGTIYRAANWKTDGRTDDERKSPRCDLMVDGKVYSRWSHVPSGAVCVRVPRVSKYRFIYCMSAAAVTPVPREGP